jgi:hypothetical protein
MYTDYTFSALELTGKVENSHPHLHSPASMGERDDLWLKSSYFKFNKLFVSFSKQACILSF